MILSTDDLLPLFVFLFKHETTLITMSDADALTDVSRCGRMIRNHPHPSCELQLAAVQQNRAAYWHIPSGQRHPDATALYERKTKERSESIARQKQYKTSKWSMGYDMTRINVGAPHKIFRQHVVKQVSPETQDR